MSEASATRAPTPIWKDERFVYPAIAVVLGVVILFSFLGAFGLWDPHEIALADIAREMVRGGDWGKVAESRPPLTMWLVGSSLSLFGVGEFAARFPLALFGLLGAVVAYAFGARIARPRAGLIAAVVLLSSPLFVFQSRQLTSDVATVTSSGAAVLGIFGLLWPRDGKHAATWLGVDAALAAVGLILGFLSSGMVIGVLVPFATASLAALFGVVGQFGRTEPHGRRVRTMHAIVAASAGALAIALVAIVFASVFDWVAPQPGQVTLGGKTLAASKQFVPILGGTWRAGDPPATATFDFLIEQVAFGMFPWSAIAPLALLRLALVKQRDRAAWGGVLLFTWALVAYVIGALFVRKVGDLRFPAMIGIAVAVALFLDDLIATRLERAPATGVMPARDGMPIAALFVACAAFQLSRDVVLFPDELAGIHVLKTVKFPVEMKPHVVVTALFGGLVGLAMVLALAVGAPIGGATAGLGDAARRFCTRYGVWGAAGGAALFAIYLSFGFTPALSQHFSYRNLFQSYFDHRTGSEPLGVMGIPGSGPEYYAHGPFEKLNSLSQLQDFLKKEQRVFVITPADKLCPLQQGSATGQFKYHVLDNRNSRFLLLTNRLEKGERDENPLLTSFRKEAPKSFSRPIRVNFENRIELLGIDMPDSASHGDKFKMTLWFRVLQRPTMNYKILVHFDGAGVRFQGDHDPIGGRCGTTFWQPGDIIADTFEVEAGQITHPRGPYDVYTGFFTGGSGQWKNMQVVEGPKDNVNRVPIGKFHVR